MVRERPTTPGQNANSTVTGQHEEHDRAPSSAPRDGGDLDQLAAPGLADVGGLGVQHVGQRRAALDRDRDALGEPRDQRQPGWWRPSGRTPTTTGSPVRTAASTRARSDDSSPPLRRTTRSSAATGLSPAATASASSSATVGNSAMILARAPAPGWSGAGRGRARRLTNPTAHSTTSDSGCRGRETARRTPYAAVTAKPARPPQHLLDPELVHGLVDAGALQPASHGRGAAEHPLDQVGGRPEHRPEDATTPSAVSSARPTWHRSTSTCGRSRT